MHRRTLRTLILGLLIALPGVALCAEAPPAESHDGLVLTPSKNADILYRRADASFAGYKRIALLDCYVAFRKNWQRDQNSGTLKVTSGDMQRIKDELAKAFREVFTEELQKDGGFTMTTESGEDVLIMRPAIIDLDVTAPDVMTAGRSYSFATNAGSMTLYVELFDGASGEILARVVDRANARENVRMQWQNSVRNSAEAERMLKKWAALARTALERARAGLPPPA
jgi:hypothetical protein